MKNKTINELTSLENPRLTDTLPIWDGTEGKTKKVSLAKIPANVITPVNSLPESPNILDRVYRYNNKYYVGNESAQTLTELASKADIPTVVDTVADGNMNPVTSNAVYDALNTLVLPSYETSTTIQCTLTNNTEHVTGTATNTTIIKLGSNFGIAIAEAHVPCTTSGTVNFRMNITGATVIKGLSINAWQSANSDSILGYDSRIDDVYLLNCMSGQNCHMRAVVLVRW